MSELLPSSASPFERAVDATLASRYPLAAELVRSTWDWRNCPAELLGYLAFQLSIDLWDDGWDETKKREVCRRALDLHRSKTTVAGIRDHLALVGANLVKVRRPPARAYLYETLTPELRRAWLDSLPQLRIYPFVKARAKARGLFLSGPTIPRYLTGYTRATDGPSLIGQRATLFDRGVERAVRVAPVPEGGVVRALVPDLRRRSYVGGYPGARFFAQHSDASGNIVTVRLSADAVGLAVAAGLRPVDIAPERIAQRAPASSAAWYLGRAGRPGFACRSTAERQIYDRVAIHRADRLGARRHTRSFLGSLRLGMDAFSAELAVQIPTQMPRRTRMRWLANAYVREPDMKPFEQALRAIAVSKAARDTIRVNTTIHRPLRFGDPIRWGEFTFGQLRKAA